MEEKELITFKKKLNNLKPKYVCIKCGKLLYLSQVKKIQLIDNSHMIWKNFNESDIPNYLSINIEDAYCMCVSCHALFMKNKLLNTFSNYGQQPKALLDLKGYRELSKISLCSMYCNTFMPTKYSYWHFSGAMNTKHKSTEQIRGTLGVILDTTYDKNNENFSRIVAAIQWLRKNNPLYSTYLSMAERIDGLFSSDTHYSSFPNIEDHNLNYYNDCLREKNSKDLNYIIDMDDKKYNRISSYDDIQIGLSVKVKKNQPCETQKIFYSDILIEAKLFPHLFPYGKGFWQKSYESITLGLYFRCRLLNFDSRWRDDKYYLFFAYDRLQKERLICMNNMIKARANLIKTNNLVDFQKNDYENYYKYGSYIPKAITGSKSYWKSKYYDLIAIINKFGNIS